MVASSWLGSGVVEERKRELNYRIVTCDSLRHICDFLWFCGMMGLLMAPSNNASLKVYVMAGAVAAAFLAGRLYFSRLVSADRKRLSQVLKQEDLEDQWERARAAAPGWMTPDRPCTQRRRTCRRRL